MANSSLSSVVSNVVRGRVGGSPLRGTITDEDLDRHIGEIILREAKAKAELYKKEGIRAYLPKSDPNVPRANKRFLSSIIKNTDEHNKAIQRTYEQVRQEREEEDRKERMRRAKEAAAARRSKEKEWSSGRRRRGRDLSEDRWRPEDDTEREILKRERNRDWSKAYENEDDEHTSRARSRSPVDRKRYWDEDEDEYEGRRHKRSHEDDEKLHKRRRRDATSRSPILVSHSHSNTRSASRSLSPSPDRRIKGKGKDKSAASHSSKRSSRHHRKRSESPSLSRASLNRIPTKDDTRLLEPPLGDESMSSSFSQKASSSHAVAPRIPKQRSHSRPPSPSVRPPSLPPSPPLLPSKMDKYFDPSYDPRLDVAPLVTNKSLTIDVPSTGLIDDPRFDSWETMLELIKIRREDRAEKKRLEKLGLLPDKKASGGSGKKGKGMVSATVVGEDLGLMDIAYTKRGTVREWDMGKEL